MDEKCRKLSDSLFVDFPLFNVCFWKQRVLKNRNNDYGNNDFWRNFGSNDVFWNSDFWKIETTILETLIFEAAVFHQYRYLFGGNGIPHRYLSAIASVSRRVSRQLCIVQQRIVSRRCIRPNLLNVKRIHAFGPYRAQKHRGVSLV